MYIYIAKHNFPPSPQYGTLQIYKVPSPTRVFKLCQFSNVEEGQVTCWVYIVLKLEIWAGASIAPIAMP